MKTFVAHSILAFSMIFTFAFAATSKPAEGQVVVRVGPQHHYYRHHYHHYYYRNHHRYYR
jgi:hypothetical protein